MIKSPLHIQIDLIDPRRPWWWSVAYHTLIYPAWPLKSDRWRMTTLTTTYGWTQNHLTLKRSGRWFWPGMQRCLIIYIYTLMKKLSYFHSRWCVSASGFWVREQDPTSESSSYYATTKFTTRVLLFVTWLLRRLSDQLNTILESWPLNRLCWLRKRIPINHVSLHLAVKKQGGGE